MPCCVFSPLVTSAFHPRGSSCSTPVLAFPQVIWLNFDGDAETYGLLAPGTSFTVDTFASHPWRVVDATSGTTVHEVVAEAGEQVVVVGPLAAPASATCQGSSSEEFTGFDGVGGPLESFAEAKVGGILAPRLQYT